MNPATDPMVDENQVIERMAWPSSERRWPR